jgi:hypothetical protein
LSITLIEQLVDGLRVGPSCYDCCTVLTRHRMTMGRPRKRPASQSRPAEDEIRNQEVLRANRELAAYFKGRRTEREARAALKIIKAFIRERERTDPATRRPLPISGQTKGPRKLTAGRPASAAVRPRRRRILRPVAPRPAAHSPTTANADDLPPKKDDES